MNREEYIKRFGKTAYEKVLQQGRDWQAQHPDEVKAHHQEQCRKGGKYYNHKRRYNTIGLQGKRNKIRDKHGYMYRPFKRIISPDSEIHHEWIPNTPNYRGVALVETDQHMHGFIDVIQILEGKITLLAEADIRGAS